MSLSRIWRALTGETGSQTLTRNDLPWMTLSPAISIARSAVVRLTPLFTSVPT